MRNLKEMTDDQLVVAFASDINEAFDVLIERHKDKIFAFILHQVKNQEVADDIFQETFVKAIMTIKQGRYTETGKFFAWVTRIARNLIIDYFRQTKSENLQSADNEEVNILNRKDLSEANVEDNIITSQIYSDVRRLVKMLPESQKEVLIMRYYKNLSFKEIADATNVSINTALGRMRYAIINMRRIAQEQDIVLTL